MPENFTIHRPAPELAVPVIVHAPHASDFIPDHCRGDFVLDDPTLREVVDAMRDRHTDRIALRAVRHGAHVVVNNVCRLVLDPERFPDDADEVAAGHGMGAVYTHTHDGRRLRRRDWTEADRRARMDEFYHPYHAAVRDLVLELQRRFRRDVHIIDLHSYPHEPHPYESGAGPRPLFCLGYEERHAPRRWLDWWDEAAGNDLDGDGAALEDLVAHNSPFAGSFVPQGLGVGEYRVRSLMIEIDRDTLAGPAVRRARPVTRHLWNVLPEFFRFACGDLREAGDRADGITERAARAIIERELQREARRSGKAVPRIREMIRSDAARRAGIYTLHSDGPVPAEPAWLAYFSGPGSGIATGGGQVAVVNVRTGEFVFHGALNDEG